MRLIEAIEKGRARVDDWCTGRIYYDHSYERSCGKTEACAIGMAWIATHDTDIDENNDGSVQKWMEQTIGKLNTTRLWITNDGSDSYEEMIENLKLEGLADLEVSP